MKFYTYGTDVILTYIVSGLLVSVMIVLLTVKHRDISMKKALPLLIFFIGGGISMIIQLNYPHITLIDLIESVICCMMYFTIENPDVKMVQQLKLAKEEADKANAAKTDFLSSMSHEIRTPLNAIVGFSDLVSEAKTLDEAKTNAKDIVNASQTLLEIVNGILDISKIEAGKLEIKESPYNAKETFEDLAKLIKPRMEEKGLDFSYFIAPDIPTTLYGDHANVKKIVTNFLSNAAKYTEKGYVKYEVNCINANGTCKLIVSVEDSGRGIKKEDVNKLFEKFDRLDVERNTTVEGTGLGMAITKQLVEMMGGKIIVHTVYGEGSKFTVMLDQKISDEQIQEAEKVSGDLNLSGIKILLVDDNDLNIKVGCKLLEKFNANLVSTAKDGFECIDKVKNNQYDLILLDDMMPKKSGTETLKDLKEIPGFNTPVIALTANAIAGMRESYLAAGFDEYLAKPIERQDLIKAVNKLLADKLSAGPVEEATHVVDNAYPTNATEAPTEETNTVIDNNQIPIPVEPTRESDEEFLRNRGVDMDKALELLGDMEMYNMTMEDFAQELENKWSKLEQEKLQNDMENYAIDVHSLKSDCKYLGFYNLADVAYEHELKSKENDSTFVNDNFERLANEYLKVLNIVKEYKDRLK
ncbi:MAG: response regulator [Bacilli bacterium]|nr:response regulator [Bacilli bacterium]